MGNTPTRYIIRRMRMAHCKRGPSRCEKCRQMNVEKICLLDIAPPDAGTIQRRVIEVDFGGVKEWREFDVAKLFKSEAEAREYARNNGIEHIDLG